ncbi:MAG: C40 family peptidase [Clostridium sp.]
MNLKKSTVGKYTLAITACISTMSLMGVQTSADTTATTQQGISLKTSELKVNKVITAPKAEVVQESTNTNARAVQKTVGSTSVNRGNYNSSSSAVNLAMSQLGKPYVYGAAGPNSFDCSGLTSYVFRQVGISIPRTSSAQYGVGAKVSKQDLRAGDLVFFNTYGSISHVGIYIGGGEFIHSPRTGKPVMISNLNSGYYKERYAGARRVM